MQTKHCDFVMQWELYYTVKRIYGDIVFDVDRTSWVDIWKYVLFPFIYITIVLKSC